MWDIIEKEGYKLYISTKIDLKLRIYEEEDVDKIYINYKGYNIAVPMLIWEFDAECADWSIETEAGCNEKEEDNSEFFLVQKADRRPFIDLIYFFMIENNVDLMLKERYKVSWNE